MEFTGERYVPALKGQIYYEHLHRYAIAARFCAGKRVLDIASGEGYGAALLAQTAADVVGVDLDEDSVEHARRTYYASNLRFLRGCVTEIPLADASIDVVASFETIEHVVEHERMLDELRRVLAPGGVVVLSSPNKLVYSDGPSFSNPFHVKELYFSELRDLLVRRFRHVALYGQRLSASSVVHPLAGIVSELASWYNGGVDRIATGLPTLSNPVYFVAVCSDEPLSHDVSSAFVDAGDDLLEDIWVELNTLRRQSAALEHAPQPALAPPEPVVMLAARDGAGDRARIVALEAELALARAQRADEFGQARARYDMEIERLREQFEAEAARLAAAYESRETSSQERVALDYERMRGLQRQLDDTRVETERARENLIAVTAQLHAERLHGQRLMEQLSELSARCAAEGDEALASAERARCADEIAARLREQLAVLADALQHAQTDSRVLREVLSSRSWKFTEPLRRAASLVRR
jgi:ubiquinone/menaquinone biosynthesis C-methylase UbiE